MKTKNIIIATVCSVLCMAGAQDARAQKVYKQSSMVVMDFGPDSGFPQTAVETATGKMVVTGYSNTTGPATENAIDGTINAKIYKKLEVASTNEAGTMSWADAYKACTDKGTNWRLPTQRELTQMWIFREALADFGVGFTIIDYTLYWSATEGAAKQAYGLGQTTGSSRTKTSLNYVRCVREIP